MADSNPIPDLVRRWQTGDQQAAADLFARYAKRLTHIARMNLSKNLAGRIDDEEVVQSAFRTFFRRSAEGEFQFDSSGQLWRLLVRITLMKARAKGRFHTAKMRDVSTEQSGDLDPWLAAAMSHEPGPDEAAALIDQIGTLLRGLPPVHGEILDLRLSGHNVSEVADKLGLSRQTVHRALKLLQQRLIRAAQEDSESPSAEKM